MFRSSRFVIAGVISALGLLVLATVLLASVHERVLLARTREHLERGDTLAGRGSLVQAVGEYHAALALERDNRVARRRLALALLSLERLTEAESYIRDLLHEDPTDGELNRALARIHVSRGREAAARTAYQRAIYGDWRSTAQEARVATRFEVVDYLRRLDAREELLAELLRLKAELPPMQIRAGRRLAGLLSDAGEPAAAIEVLNASATTAPRDVELLTHLADLQAEAGRTLDARATLQRAIALDPTRTALVERLLVIDRVLALDPTLPRLRLVTRTRRARLVLAAVVDEARRCRDSHPSGDAPDWQDATSRLRRPAPRSAEAAEAEMALAARLWAAAPACHASSPEARAIAQVLQRIDAATEPPS